MHSPSKSQTYNYYVPGLPKFPATRPKSPTLSLFLSPRHWNIFEGFKSLWASFLLCMYFTASKIWKYTKHRWYIKDAGFMQFYILRAKNHSYISNILNLTCSKKLSNSVLLRFLWVSSHCLRVLPQSSVRISKYGIPCTLSPYVAACVVTESVFNFLKEISCGNQQPDLQNYQEIGTKNNDKSISIVESFHGIKKAGSYTWTVRIRWLRYLGLSVCQLYSTTHFWNLCSSQKQ